MIWKYVIYWAEIIQHCVCESCTSLLQIVSWTPCWLPFSLLISSQNHDSLAFFMTSWLAWLWLWSINIGYTKLGLFFLKLRLNWLGLEDFLIFFELEELRWQKCLNLDFPDDFHVSKIDLIFLKKLLVKVVY